MGNTSFVVTAVGNVTVSFKTHYIPKRLTRGLPDYEMITLEPKHSTPKQALLIQPGITPLIISRTAE